LDTHAESVPFKVCLRFDKRNAREHRETAISGIADKYPESHSGSDVERDKGCPLIRFFRLKVVVRGDMGLSLEERKGLLAYCGTYCVDCLGYTGVIAEAARGFLETLERYRFEQTAACVFPEELNNYKLFLEMLGFMTGLECTGRCRAGKDAETSCEIRRCCRERGYYSCYECDEFEACEKQDEHFDGLHAKANRRNLRAIREMGLEAWLTEGRRHCYWGGIDASGVAAQGA